MRAVAGYAAQQRTLVTTAPWRRRDRGPIHLVRRKEHGDGLGRNFRPLARRQHYHPPRGLCVCRPDCHLGRDGFWEQD
jgi:hypothetical protein